MPHFLNQCTCRFFQMGARVDNCASLSVTILSTLKSHLPSTVSTGCIPIAQVARTKAMRLGVYDLGMAATTCTLLAFDDCEIMRTCPEAINDVMKYTHLDSRWLLPEH